MKACTVFWNRRIWKEDNYWINSRDCPDGAYMLQNSRTWYVVMGRGFTPINLCDVPKELRLLALLLQ